MRKCSFVLQDKRSFFFGFVVILAAGYLQIATAADWVPFSSALPEGSRCIVDISMLHPTQFAVGYWEVERRAEKVVTKTPKKMEKYLQEHIGKVVVGPLGEPYIIDRHHLAFLMTKTGKSPTIYATVEANFASMPVDGFWKEMVKRKWAYLYDGRGKGPLDPHALPKNVKDLDDDPFRSLAWAVRERGGYHESREPFAEFRWADYFREKFSVETLHADMEQAIEDALKICHMPSAAGLPGYFKDSGPPESSK
jgi:hypothetical protein